jgi:hypothetical protein
MERDKRRPPKSPINGALEVRTTKVTSRLYSPDGPWHPASAGIQLWLNFLSRIGGIAYLAVRGRGSPV